MASQSQAALVAYEGFNYGFAQDINGQATSGTGFTGNWTVTQDTSQATNDDFIETRGNGESFGFGTLTETGRAVRKQSGADTTHIFVAASATLSSSAAFADGNTVWLSFLSDWSSGNTAISLGDSGFEAESRNNARLVSGNGLGVFLDNNDGGAQGSALGVEAALFNTTAVAAQQSNLGIDPIVGDVLYLVKFELSAVNDVVTVYQVDNTGASTQAGQYTASVDNTGFDTLSILSGSSVVFDEFRVGTELTDVTPGLTVTGAAVPEPSTVALLGLGFGSLLMLRRKK